jgi:hypothetical protein
MELVAPSSPPPRPRPSWDLYEPLLLEAMRVGSLSINAGSGERAFRGLFKPSFHSDVCITVDVTPGGGDIELVVLSPEARLKALHTIGINMGVDPEAFMSPPPPWTARAALDPASAARFVATIDALDRAELGAPPPRGCDGMSLTGEIADANGVARFSAWSPERTTEPAQHAFFAGLHALAKESIKEAQAQLVLEQLHGYLGLGLPVVDLGGEPRHVRIFGSLSWPAPAELVAIVKALITDQPLLMDLSNFEGMGTGLYPLFGELARRPGPTAWCASEPARAHLEEIGVDSRAIFGEIAAARAALDGSALPR